ncbi:MbcA/ParS/Xre antitoxin family protein [Actimicrobium sp. GrIS 1.19]|uniref:MbcA/ParS/Xre antitoxin family protein n=1 Tax=Actimicrobium sp. GrIS 1.19 TaxID=3071708 RepID=UPI002E111282
MAGMENDEAKSPVGLAITKAVMRAARLLKFEQALLARILGVSAPTASRMIAGHDVLGQDRPGEWESGLLLVRLFFSLDAILGHGEKARAWLAGANLALGARPLDLVASTEGLARVLHCLDTRRGRI